MYPLANPMTFIGKEEQYEKAYFESMTYLENYKVKEHLNRFAEDLITDGEAYYYKYETKNGVAYQKLSNKCCIPYYQDVDTGVMRFAIDMGKVDKDGGYPDEIQKAIELFKKNKNNSIFQNGYYIVSDNGVCFTLSDEGHGIPPLVCIYSDIVSLEGKKNFQNALDRINNTKMIHSEIPMSSKTDMPALDPIVAAKYNEVIKNKLIEQGLEEVFSIVNPFKISSINLNTDTAKSGNNMVQMSVEQLYNEIGVSKGIFNSDKSSTSQKYAIQVDTMSAVSQLLLKFETFLNAEMKKRKGKIQFGVKILDNTGFNSDDRIKTAHSQLGMGGSLEYYYACLGFTPLQGFNLLSYEYVLRLKERVTVIQSAHTTSNKNGTDNEVGRRSAEEIKSDGDEIADTTENNLENGGYN